MSTSNPAPGVGGTAKDGGLSTAATVADGGPNDQNPDGQYVPEGVISSEKPFVSICSVELQVAKCCQHYEKPDQCEDVECSTRSWWHRVRTVTA